MQDGNTATGPTSNVGRLCLWSQDNAEDDPDKFEQFPDYRQTLTLKCASDGSAGTFTWTPDANTPDIVYYQVLERAHIKMENECARTRVVLIRREA